MWEGYRRESRGSVFLLAMVALVALLFLGTSLVEVAMQGLAGASRQQKRAEALALAEAGIDMALAKLYDNYDGANTTLESTGVYTDSFTLGQGTVSYIATSPYAGLTHSCTIESTGTTRTHMTETVRIVAIYLSDVDRVFQGAIFCDSPLTLKGGGAVFPDANGVGGTIYANGYINFDTSGQNSFEMTAEGEIYTTVDAPTWVPPQLLPQNVHERIAALPMPSIDLKYYRDRATTYFSSRQSFKDPDLTAWGNIIYVNGSLDLSGIYTGSAVIVATGTITINGKFRSANPGVDSVVLISPKSIKMGGGTMTTIDGLIYSHGIDAPSGGVTGGGGLTVNGAIVADTVRVSGSLTVNYTNVWGGLDLPGRGKSQWAQISWEELL